MKVDEVRLLAEVRGVAVAVARLEGLLAASVLLAACPVCDGQGRVACGPGDAAADLAAPRPRADGTVLCGCRAAALRCLRVAGWLPVAAAAS